MDKCFENAILSMRGKEFSDWYHFRLTFTTAYSVTEGLGPWVTNLSWKQDELTTWVPDGVGSQRRQPSAIFHTRELMVIKNCEEFALLVSCQETHDTWTKDKRFLAYLSARAAGLTSLLLGTQVSWGQCASKWALVLSGHNPEVRKFQSSVVSCKQAFLNFAPEEISLLPWTADKCVLFGERH